MFKRRAAEKLGAWATKSQRKPLIVNGARQVGKTFLLKTFAQQNFKTFHYFNFETEINYRRAFAESLEPEKIISKLSLESGKPIKPESDLVIFDEIQACPEALTSLKYFNERRPDIYVASAGSLLGVKLNSASFPVGQVEYLDLFPLTFYEFLLAVDEELLARELFNIGELSNYSQTLHERLWSQWKLYLVIGGLPAVIKAYREAPKNLQAQLSAGREVQLELINEYLKDFAKNSGPANSLHLERVFRSIPAQLAKAQDDSVGRFRFSGVVPKISQYARLASAFDWLQGAGLAYKIPLIDSAQPPLIQHVKESFFKLYLFDVGILCALGDISPKDIINFEFSSYKGYLAENFVLQQLKAQGLKSLYGWNEGQSEIEFIFQSYQGVRPIEVKSGRVTQAKSLANFLRRYPTDQAFIFGATPPRVDGKTKRLPIFAAGVYKVDE